MTSSSWPTSIEAVKRRIYLLGLPLGTCCSALIWVAEASSGTLHVVDYFGLPLLALLFVCLALGVRYRPQHLYAYEVSLFVGFALMYLASLGYSLSTFANETAAIWNLAGLGYWGAVLYTLAFLVFGSQRGFWYSAALYLLTMITSLSYFVFVPPAEVVPGTLSLFSQHFASNGLVLFLLSAISHALATQATAAAQLEHEAGTDPLTLLDNRRRIGQQLELEAARVERQGGVFSVAMLDIDFFKRVNDEHGHAVGDEVLKEVSDLIRDETRAMDTVGRWGGEEFVLLLPSLPLDEAREAVERLRLTISAHSFQVVGHLTVSVGVAQYRTDETLESLLQRVDRALYGAKAEGRNKVMTEQDPKVYKAVTPGELLN